MDIPQEMTDIGIAVLLNLSDHRIRIRILISIRRSFKVVRSL